MQKRINILPCKPIEKKRKEREDISEDIVSMLVIYNFEKSMGLVIMGLSYRDVFQKWI